MGLKSPLSLGPLLVNLHLQYPRGLHIMNRHKYNPAPPGRFIPSGYIPNIRPQVDLNWFTPIFNT